MKKNYLPQKSTEVEINGQRERNRTGKVHQKVLQLNLNENCTYTRESLVKLKKVFLLIPPPWSNESIFFVRSTLDVINNLLTCSSFFLSPFLSLLSGPNVKIAIAILNCILARQLCFEDPSCSAILEIIPRVCGPVPGKKTFCT